MGKYVEFDWPFEISGFGGGYEDACRRMTIVGVNWLRNHPEEVKLWNAAEAKWKKDNPDKKYMPNSAYPDSRREFEQEIVSACEDCTGAMFGAAVGHAKAIVSMGWDKYVDNVLEHRKNRD